MTSVEGPFDRGQGKGAAIGNLKGKLSRLFLKFVVGDHAVDHAQCKRLASRYPRVGVSNFFGFLFADEVLKVLRAIAGIE